jgi:hypothetical protein
MNLKMQLDDLTPLAVYCENEKLIYRQVLAKALAGKVELYYVFDRWAEVTYVLEEDFINGTVTDKNFREAPSCVEKSYNICDFIPLTDSYLKGLWKAENSSNTWLYFEELFELGSPEGYVVASLDRESDDEAIIDNLFINPNPRLSTTKEQTSDKGLAKPSTTALKVIGLLMHHLAKSPKYASGTTPNKSQIKELLLELAVELDVNNYGLSKVDERLLAEAMKYLETQKN